MMVALLLNAYSRGVFSVVQAREVRVDFMAVTAMNQPGFRIIARFQQCSPEVAGRFARAGAQLDGTKVQANASVHKAIFCGRMLETEKRLTAEASTRRRGSIVFGPASRRSTPKSRRRCQMAMGPADPLVMMRSGKPDCAPDGGSPDRTQRNFTNPDSHTQWTRSGAVVAGHNAQIAIASADQTIVVKHLQTSRTDARVRAPLLSDIRAMQRTNPKEVSADAGYCDEKSLLQLARRRIAGYLARRGARQPSECRRPSTMAQGLAQGRCGDKTQAPRPIAAACESRSSNRCSAKSNTPEAFVSSAFGASTRSEPSEHDLHGPQLNLTNATG
jgi:hypothetical protein